MNSHFHIIKETFKLVKQKEKTTIIVKKERDDLADPEAGGGWITPDSY